MNNQELFCQQHGYYPASYRTCPWCAQAGGVRAAGAADEAATADFSGRAYSDDDETVPPGGVRSTLKVGADDDQTQPPIRNRGGAVDDETQLPLRKTKRILDREPVDDELDETVLDREDTSAMGWLIVKRSPYMRRGQVIKIRNGAIIGRSGKAAHILIDDDKVSGIHARIQVRDSDFFVIDLGSSNGTYVNDEVISGTTQIRQDDTVRVGDTVMVLKTL